MAAKKGLGELLVRSNIISFEELMEAKKTQRESGGRLITALVKKGFVKESELSEFLAKDHNLPTIDLSLFEISDELIQLVPKRICEKYLVFPVQKADRTLVVAFADPRNSYVKDDLALITRCKINMVVASESSILGAIEKYYDGGSSGKMTSLAKDLKSVTAADGINDAKVEVIDDSDTKKNGPVIKFVNAMLTEAIKKKASDIHIEPYEKRLRIRFRVNGTLMEEGEPSQSSAGAIVSRLKVLCKMDISQKRLPQDGRLKVRLAKGTGIDFRVSCLPTIFGEKMVLRLLDKSNLELNLESLGLDEQEFKIFKDSIYQPQGMILITGPTGSGKTTTIYSALSELNTEERNISTAEDPVEFNLDGINQVQIQSNIGLTFPKALKAFLRQDPEIIMVGEIRDLETGGIAYKAASTGHLVVSTLHTNDAVSTIMRLVNMGLPPYMVAEATTLVVAQRLVKLLCPKCKYDFKPDQDVLLELGIPQAALGSFSTLYKADGCSYCNNTGAKGRAPVFEVLNFQGNIIDAIVKGLSAKEIKRIAVFENGMKSLRMNALVKLQQGLTSIEQVINVTVKDDL